MLATVREEDVIKYLNSKHTKPQEMYRERPVFAQWMQDTPETIAAMIAHDKV